ncbi:maternal protein exuperantia-1-like isoform X2 [Lutzomyia longipalpis]|uniref:maternal protein exuperantia-1-like isoform X2 n=1 Tax=Lutzomyia longipalpis TaxID=7200 RepID=UPI0024840EB6|nr:maternal protein exuperantia-1-like isoform X2 [Lutzomyia longipalpis]
MQGEEAKPAVMLVVKQATTEKERTVVFYRDIMGITRTIKENLQELDYSLYHRVKGVTFRPFLAEQGFVMRKLQDLQDIWGKEKRDGIRVAVAELRELKEDDTT